MWIGRTDAQSCGPRCRACAVLRGAVPGAVAGRGIGAVTLEDVAAAAGVRAADAEVHAHGDLTGLLGSAYLAHAGRLQAGFRADFLAAATPREGLERSVRGLLRAVAEDPARTRYCYVEITRGAAPLRALRAQIARGSVGLWAEVHRAGARGWLPPTHFEVVNNAVIHLIADHAAGDRVDELPARAEAVLALVDPPAGRRRLAPV